MNDNQNGIGFLGLLTLIFITLKLVGTIDWSWWWVLAPMWIPMAILAVVLAVGATVYGVTYIFEKWLD